MAIKGQQMYRWVETRRNRNRNDPSIEAVANLSIQSLSFLGKIELPAENAAVASHVQLMEWQDGRVAGMAEGRTHWAWLPQLGEYEWTPITLPIAKMPNTYIYVTAVGRVP